MKVTDQIIKIACEQYAYIGGSPNWYAMKAALQAVFNNTEQKPEIKNYPGCKVNLYQDAYECEKEERQTLSQFAESEYSSKLNKKLIEQKARLMPILKGASLFALNAKNYEYTHSDLQVIGGELIVDIASVLEELN